MRKIPGGMFRVTLASHDRAAKTVSMTGSSQSTDDGPEVDRQEKKCPPRAFDMHLTCRLRRPAMLAEL